MHRRPSLRAVVTTIAAAVVLVSGAGLASYAASGHPLLLAHHNAAATTTALKNSGRGPALSLSNATSAPPLVVNSTKMVKHLNANLVGGQTAARLAPRTIRLQLGRVGTTFTASGFRLRSAKIPPGTYAVGVTGLVLDNNAGNTDNMACLIADRKMLLGALNGGGLNYAQVYALDGSRAGDENFGVLDNQNLAQRVSGPVAFGCNFTGTGAFRAGRAVTFTLKPVTVVDKGSQPIVLSRSARHQRLSLR